MRGFDQLRAERKAHFAGDNANAVKRTLVILCCIARFHTRCKGRHIARQFQRCAIDQRVEQFRAAAQLLCQSGGKTKDSNQLVEQPRARFQQAEQIDRRAG